MDIKLQQIFHSRFSFMEDVYIECGDGWSGLLYGLCSHLEQYYKLKGYDPNTIEVLQIKEKYNGLRFYVGDIKRGAYDIIMIYEELSYNIDEYTGLLKKEM